MKTRLLAGLVTLSLLGGCADSVDGRPDFTGEGDGYSAIGIVRGVNTKEGSVTVRVIEVREANGEAEDRLKEHQEVDFYTEYNGEVDGDDTTDCVDIASDPEITGPDGSNQELRDLPGLEVWIEGRTVDTIRGGGACDGSPSTEQREILLDIRVLGPASESALGRFR
ncbi:MAG TPA: hypothetical protein VK674_03270 [Candidatus Limnocylindria bacterium]|nr:hypothetical protein [Candidatus Limnocylindria bacterium]